MVNYFVWGFCLGFFNQSWNWGWPWWRAGLQNVGSIWVESFLSTVAVMTQACSSHIWLNSTALTSCALCWPWELARGCGKGIVFPNTEALCCLCVIAYTCLCVITLSTQQGRHLWHFGCPQGKVQFGHLVEKVARAAMQLLPCYIIRIWQWWISAAPACLATPADGVHTKIALPKSIKSVNHLIYLDYHENAGNISIFLSFYRIEGILLKIAICKNTLLVSVWPDSCMFVKINVSSNM